MRPSLRIEWECVARLYQCVRPHTSRAVTYVWICITCGVVRFVQDRNSLFMKRLKILSVKVTLHVQIRYLQGVLCCSLNILTEYSHRLSEGHCTYVPVFEHHVLCRITWRGATYGRQGMRLHVGICVYNYSPRVYVCYVCVSAKSDGYEIMMTILFMQTDAGLRWTNLGCFFNLLFFRSGFCY